jgi:hypothetical protein
MSHAQTPDRPWYCTDGMVDDWVTVERRGGDLKMLKALKIIRAIIVNIGVSVIALFALTSGGDPTIIPALALVILGAYNGVEYSDYQALVQAIAEVQASETETDTENDNAR